MFCKKTPLSKATDELPVLCGDSANWASGYSETDSNVLPQTCCQHWKHTQRCFGEQRMKSALMPGESKQYTLFPCSLFNLLCRYMSQQELEENIIPVSLFSPDNRGKLQPYGGCNFARAKRRKQIPSTVVFNPLPTFFNVCILFHSFHWSKICEEH